MGGLGRRLGAAIGAVTLVLLGVCSHHWWVASVKGMGEGPSAYFGLRSMLECTGGTCVSVPYKMAMHGTGAAFSLFGALAFFAGIVAAVILAVGAAVRELKGVDSVATAASGLFGIVAFASIATVISFPAESSASAIVPIESSMGFSFYLTLIGAIVGAVAGRLREGGGGWEGRTYIPVRIDRSTSRPSPMSSAGPAPANPSPTADRSPLTASDDRASVDPVRARGADREGLRFVARSIEVSGVGMTAVREDGSEVDLLWTQVGRVVARRMPPDPPHDGQLFVDIIPAAAGSRPIRIVPTVRANWGDLPGGAAVSSRDSLRKLGALIEQHRRGVVEPNSVGFFLENQRAPAFQAARQLAEYEAQFI